MDLDGITTFLDFRDYLRQLVDSAESYTGSLEDYLRAVMRSVLERGRDEYTWKLQAQILAEGMTMAPLPFDEAWLTFIGPGELVRVNSGAELVNEYGALLDLLKYQIADLHRLGETGALESSYRHMGLNSTVGLYAWYSFTPHDFLGQALLYFHGGAKNSDVCSWHDLGILLWIGQIYE